MYREEILDMAMDILDNTDATLEEAMGIAIESAENKMSDAEKYRRRRLKAIKYPRHLDDRADRLRILPPIEFPKGYIYPGYHGIRPNQKADIDRETGKAADKYLKELRKSGKDPYEMTRRSRADMAKVVNHGKIQSNINNYGHPYQTRKGAKEAAIMDTAFDFLDMYDVSLEEAIDMAYDYLAD